MLSLSLRSAAPRAPRALRALQARRLCAPAASGAGPGAAPGDAARARPEEHRAGEGAGAAAEPGARGARSARDPDAGADVDALVSAALAQVRALGWSDAAVRAGVRELGWSPAAAGMLPGGGGELALRFVTRCNVQLARDLSAPAPAPPAPAPPGPGAGAAAPDAAPAAPAAPAPAALPAAGERAARLQHAVRARLGMAAAYHGTWGGALAQLARPAHAAGAARQAALLADELAHFAGFHDPQFGWYADRAVVAALYAATELFWVADRSPGQADTWGFLESNVERAERLRGDAAAAVHSVMSATDLTSATISSFVRSVRGRY